MKYLDTFDNINSKIKKITYNKHIRKMAHMNQIM